MSIRWPIGIYWEVLKKKSLKTLRCFRSIYNNNISIVVVGRILIDNEIEFDHENLRGEDSDTNTWLHQTTEWEKKETFTGPKRKYLYVKECDFESWPQNSKSSVHMMGNTGD